MKLKDMEDADWNKMLKVHLYGTFHCSREALKVMEAKSYGKIVSISSIAATVGLEGAPHYSAAKAGILGFTRSLAREVGPRGITVNAIAPLHRDRDDRAALAADASGLDYEHAAQKVRQASGYRRGRALLSLR